MGRAGALERVESRLRDFLRRYVPSGADALLVAYSGGPDSTALLAAAARLRPNQLLAVYVDHGIRPAAERETEAELVKSTCRRLGVRLTVARIRSGAVAERARVKGCGIEAAARAYRYHILRRVLDREAGSHVLLAHTKDDQAETVLMRLIGGSGAEALGGMGAANPPWYRPFLGLAKRELLSYLRSRRLEWSIDSTNASADYLRNRLRLRLMPLMDLEFPGWRTGLALTAERAMLDARAVREEAASIPFEPDGAGRLATAAEPFFAAPEAVRVAAVTAAAGRLLGRERLSLKMLRAALTAVGRRDDGRYWGGGVRLERSQGRLVLGRGLDFPRHGGYFVVIDRPCRVRAGDLVVEASWTTAGIRGIRALAFRFPLVVRSRRPGDSIAVPGGRKRLDALFSEWGMPPQLRGVVPVVEDRDGIVAVLGAAFGASDRYRKGPRGNEAEHPLFLIDVKGA